MADTFKIHEFAMDKIPRACSWVIIGPPGSGKCLAPETPVLMYDGATRYAKDIVEGDLLLGDDSTPRKVLSITSGRDPMYRISQSNGKDYVANGAHQLVLKYNNDTIVISVNRYLNLPQTTKDEYKGYKIKSQNIITSKISITSLGEGEYCGFMTDGNSRFLLGDFTVTHNSNIIEYMAYVHRSRYPVVKIMSGTEDSNRAYEKWAPKINITEGYIEQQEKSYIIRQRRCRANGCKNGAAINIIDDCSDDAKIYKSPTYQGLYKNGSRHWDGLIITGLQYGIDFPPAVRKSANYVALAYEADANERKKLYDNFGGACGTYKEFCEIMEQLIKGPDNSDRYTFMIIKKINQSANREENVFYLKAPKMKNVKWKFGCNEIWKWDKDRRDKSKAHSYGLE